MKHVRETRTLTLDYDTETGHRMINQYVVDSELGRGVFGSVKLAHDVYSRANVAIKIVQREAPRKLGVPYTPRQTDERVVREIRAMSLCLHPNVVQLFEVIDDPMSRKLFLITEYMQGGELVWRDELEQPTLSLTDARRVFRDILHGLNALHENGIIHRDLKPANILWTRDRTMAKINDFGSAYVRMTPSSVDELSSATDPVLARTAGSPAFFAPELCYGASDGPPITKAIDVWALGVTLYCMLFGHVPFDAETEYLLLECIVHDDYAVPTCMCCDRVIVGPRAPRWAPLYPNSQDLCGSGSGNTYSKSAGTDSRNESTKPAETNRSHSLSNEAHAVRHLLDALLDKDPATRMTLDRAMTHPWLVAVSW